MQSSMISLLKLDQWNQWTSCLHLRFILLLLFFKIKIKLLNIYVSSWFCQKVKPCWLQSASQPVISRFHADLQENWKPHSCKYIVVNEMEIQSTFTKSWDHIYCCALWLLQSLTFKLHFRSFCMQKQEASLLTTQNMIYSLNYKNMKTNYYQKP